MASISYKYEPEDVRAVLAEALRRFHTRLVDLDLRVNVLKAYKEDEEGNSIPAVKLHGHPASAVARKFDLKKRIQTEFDVEILVDGLSWDSLPERQRLALIDHELTHFEVAKDKDGRVKIDDIGRPIIKMRLDDYCLTGFLEVCQRHGDFALEAKSILGAAAGIREAIEEASQRMADKIAAA